VLIALCRPFKGGRSDATPATNPQIAGELFLTVAAVKTHLRALDRFDEPTMAVPASAGASAQARTTGVADYGGGVHPVAGP
jgi:hypothetical protein